MRNLSTDAEDDSPYYDNSVDDGCVGPPDVPLPESVKIQLLTECHPENKVTT